MSNKRISPKTFIPSEFPGQHPDILIDKSQRPQKHLGQNFLVDANIKEKILDACGLTPSDIVLEIGPGQGALTEKIASRVKHLTAIDIDKTLVESLRSRLIGKNIKLIHGDFLKLDLASFPENLKVIGNLPYYLSTPIIVKLLQNCFGLSKIFITVQREFGERLIARPDSKAYGALSLFVQFHAQTKILFKIKNTSFRPVPKVHSCFLEMTPRTRAPVDIADKSLFWSIIRRVFTQRRKKILNAAGGLDNKENLLRCLEAAHIAPTLRPENLTLQNFADFANELRRRQ